mmetsp:Transcript_30579/g.46897  ORF Transcript_30579/g.46897 Transcript_30579/m.46897 type:complete len:138 (-) Transcript_30579:208-621(-)
MRPSHEEALKELNEAEEVKQGHKLMTIEERKNNESSTLSKKEEIQKLKEGMDKLVPKQDGGRSQKLHIIASDSRGMKTEGKDNLISFESEREKVPLEDSVVIQDETGENNKATIDSVNIIDEKYFERSNNPPGPTSI